MLAVAKTNAGPGLELVTADVPAPGRKEVLVHVRACGVCGSDVRLYQWQHHPLLSMQARFPVIIGHEFSGEIAALGQGAGDRGLRVGDAIAVEPNITCGRCWCCESGMPNLCRQMAHVGLTSDGGMAEYCVVPVESAYPMPSNLTFVEGALLETLAVAVHAARKMPVPDDSTVAVIGLGPVGLLLLQVLKATTSARVIAVGTSRGSRRVSLAKSLGADHCLASGKDDVQERVLGLTGGKGVDFAFEAAGPAAATVDAIQMTRPGGQVCLVGILDENPALKPYTMVRRREIGISTSSGRVPSDWDVLLDLAASGRVRIAPIIGKEIPLPQAVDAFELLLRDRDIVKAAITI